MIEDNSVYAGYAYSDAPDSEVICGKILVGAFRLRFESPETTLEIPLVRLDIEMGEPTDRRVYFSHCGHPEWTIYTFEEKILKNRCLRQQAHTRNQILEIESSGELKRRLKITAGLLAGFAFVGLLIFLASGLLVDMLVAKIPPSWETQLGETLMEEMRQEETFRSDPVLEQKVKTAVQPLLAALPGGGKGYKFYLLDDPLPNAFALPGGHVLITAGLMEMVERPEELAAVVAHEIAHVTERHGFRKILSAAGPYLVIRLVIRDDSGLLGVLGQSSELLVRQSFSQEYELEADSVGWDYLVQARIDPRALPQMLAKLELSQRDMGYGDGLKAFSSHPDTEKRIRRLEDKWHSLRQKPAFRAYDAWD